MKTRMFGFLAALVFFSGIAWADLNIELSAPELQDGMQSIESMLQTEAESFLDEILVLVEETLDKPLFMSAFTGATMTSSLLPGLLGAEEGFVISIGSAGAIWSADYSAETFAAISAIDATTDLELGACIQPLTLQIAVPLRRLLPGLRAGANIGWMEASGAQLGIKAFSAGAFTGLRLFNKPGNSSAIRWDGLEINAGGGYSAGTLSMTITPGTIYQAIPLDPDGAGPLLPLSTAISVDPSIDAGVRSSTIGGKLGFSTGIALFDVLSLSIGGGCGLSSGTSAISIDAQDQEIIVEGYLANLVEENGSITITGTTAELGDIAFSPYLDARLGFKVGVFTIAMPVVWNIPKGLGVAVLVEAYL